ncbi:conserved hypothetical protein [Theileria equi strain WA]|uniref:Protein kinase domain-containing protein n=1 Tax=Theileria equi strain WA TaxID=1537102 RepID=L1LES4_THEEQ|nr:conserved hypothetical protein [Theileria equi strain WA]EKX73841.1 conserved hypothetical protein [Theileria equi strain WA]|eukprot:XP_004833293.1 conserved hypothetical protein [Theileria equi strain WA]
MKEDVADGDEAKGVKRKTETSPENPGVKVKREAVEVPVKVEDAVGTELSLENTLKKESDVVKNEGIKKEENDKDIASLEIKTQESPQSSGIESRFKPLGKHLGEGTYGQVVKALDTLTGRYV